MENSDALKLALRGDTTIDRREVRAARTRAIAFSPSRILLRLALVPVTTLALTVSIFSATSPFGKEDSLRHLVALGGCDAAAQIGMFNIAEGQPGYHAANDDDKDGVACEDPTLTLAASGGSLEASTTGVPAESLPGQANASSVGGAKFIKP